MANKQCNLWVQVRPNLGLRYWSFIIEKNLFKFAIVTTHMHMYNVINDLKPLVWHQSLKQSPSKTKSASANLLSTIDLNWLFYTLCLNNSPDGTKLICCLIPQELSWIILTILPSPFFKDTICWPLIRYSTFPSRSPLEKGWYGMSLNCSGIAQGPHPTGLSWICGGLKYAIFLPAKRDRLSASFSD